MNNRKSTTGESGSFNLFTLGVAVIAVCTVGVLIMLAPAAATSEASTQGSATPAAVGDGPGYLPAQYVNQAKEIEPVQDYSAAF